MTLELSLKEYGRLMSLADIEDALQINTKTARYVMQQLPPVSIQDEWGELHHRVLTADLVRWLKTRPVLA